MKTVHDFICKTNEAINIVNILSNAWRKHFHCRSKRSAVGFRDVFTAFKRNDVKNCFHDLVAGYFLQSFSISSETSFPEINAGGTPGPGTVNCPVKYKFCTFLLRNLGLKNAV